MSRRGRGCQGVGKGVKERERVSRRGRVLLGQREGQDYLVKERERASRRVERIMERERASRRGNEGQGEGMRAKERKRASR